MADYIRRTVLAEAYLHVEHEAEDLTADEISALKSHVRSYLEKRSKFFLYEDVAVEIEVNEGSLKVVATVVGSLWMALSTYADVRTGVQLLYDDVRTLSEAAILESRFAAGARRSDVIRQEARPGVVGSLRQILVDFDVLVAQSPQLTPEQIANRIEKLRERIDRISSALQDTDDQEYVLAQLQHFAAQLPERPNVPSDPTKRRDAAALVRYRDERKEIRRLLGVQ